MPCISNAGRRAVLAILLTLPSGRAHAGETCLEPARHDRIDLAEVEGTRSANPDGFREVELADPNEWHVLVRRGGWIRAGVEVSLVTPDADVSFPHLVADLDPAPILFHGRTFRASVSGLGTSTPFLEVYGPDDGQPFQGTLAGLAEESRPGIPGPLARRDAVGGCLGIRPGALGAAPGVFLTRRELSFAAGRFAIVRFASAGFLPGGRAGYLLLDRVRERWRTLWSAPLGPLDDVEGVLSEDRLVLRRVPAGPALFPEEGGPWLGRLGPDGAEPLLGAWSRSQE